MAGTSPDALAERMREWLITRGWTQQDLADRAGVSLATVSNLCRGVGHLPHATTLSKIAKALDVTPYQLLNDVPKMPLSPELQELVRRYLRKSKIHQKLVMTMVRDLPDAPSPPKGSK